MSENVTSQVWRDVDKIVAEASFRMVRLTQVKDVPDDGFDPTDRIISIITTALLSDDAVEAGAEALYMAQNHPEIHCQWGEFVRDTPFLSDKYRKQAAAAIAAAVRSAKEAK